MQSGTVTPTHMACWTTNGVIQDCGTAVSSFLTTLGVTASGPALCQSSALPTAGAYNQLCFNTTSTGGGFTWTSYNGATGVPSMTINGTVYPFPFSAPGGIVGPGTTVLNDLMCWGNTAGTLASDCGLAIGTPTANELLYFSSTSAISALTKANSSVLVSNGSGVPSWATTLPSTLTIPGPTISSPTISGTATGPDSGTWGSGGINGSAIGASTAEPGHFTTLVASSTVSGTGFSTYLASPPAIGGSAAAAGSFTTLIVTSQSTFAGIKVAVRTASSTTDSITTADYFVCADNSGGAATEDLPSSPATGLTFLVKDCGGSAATHNITVTPATGNVDGSATFVMNANYQSTAFTYTGSQWSTN